jgi:signal transduction histidine kinase
MEEVKILIIEDDLSFAGLLQDQLTQIGFNPYNLICVDSIADTRLVKLEFEPDVILLDLNIRDSFGIQTYDEVHAIFKDTTLVVLSGLDDKKVSLEIVAKGAQDYLLKTEINAGVIEKTIKYGMLRRTFRLQLAESEKKYKDLFYNSPLPMLMLRMRDFKVLFCNQAALDLYEANSDDEMVGKSLNDFFVSENKLSITHPKKGSEPLLFYQTTNRGKELITEIILNKLQEDKEAIIALVVDKTEEIRFEKSKYEIIAHAEEGEKRKIARELHDGLGQQLVLLNLLIQNIQTDASQKEAMDNINQILQSSIREVKEMAYSLLPPDLDKGFLNAVDRLAHRINGLGELTIVVDISDEVHEDDFANVDAFNLYRILQEAVNNAIKHAKASEISIQIGKKQGKIQLRICDNGIGFSMGEVEEGLGLQNMRHRISMSNIVGDIKSQPGQGTTVELKFEA